MTAPVPEVDPGLLAALKSAPDHGGWRAGMDDDDYLDLARAVQGCIEGRVEVAVVGALESAAERIEAHRNEQHDGPPITLHGGVTFWVGDAFYDEAAQIVRSQATSGDLAASTPDGGRESVRGGEGA